MTVASLEFLVGVLLLTSVFPLLPGPRSRQIVLGAFNVAFLSTLVPDGWAALVLVLFLLSGYGYARLSPHVRVPFALTSYVVLLVGAFVVLKRYTVLESILPATLMAHPVQLVGLSYMLFRQLHFVADVREGQIRQFSLWTYANYQVNFLTLIAGPIQRFEDFSRQWRSLEPRFRSSGELARPYLRMFWGVLQISLLGAICLDVYQGAVRDAGGARWIRMASVLYAYPAYVYLNFSGYCNLVIGAAALLGLKLPENFNRPVLARNVLDFWSRWHMTLTHFLRDYVFTPLYKLVARNWPARSLWLAPGCYLVVFLVAGAWHGSTANFLVFGALHGVGAAAAKGWETLIVKRRGRSGLRSYLQSPLIRVVARTVNLNYVCATFLFFPSGFTHCMGVIRSVFLGGPA